MQKHNNNSTFPISFLKNNWLFPKTGSGFTVLKQMPSHQLDFFLSQSFEKKEQITIQLNSSSLCSTLRETKGKITHLSSDNKQVLLAYQNTVAIIETKDIRHIRLVSK